MKLLFYIFLSLPLIVHGDIIYKKLDSKDAQKRTIVSLKIEGNIEFGDAMIFEEALADINQNKYRVQFDSVILDSPGGNIYEAMQIGYAIRGNHLSTWVLPHDSCRSACVLILQAGVCKMANGEVGIHRTKYEEDIPLEEIRDNVNYHEATIEEYLSVMGAPPQLISFFSIIPNWEMKYLSNYEKRNFGLFNATSEEMQYRLEIASKKLGRFKEDLLNHLSERQLELYPDASWDSSDYIYATPSCSEQLFLEDNISDHVGIDIEPAPENIFEIYNWGQGIEDDQGEFIYTDIIPHKEGQNYFFSFNYFAKGKEVTLHERLTLAGPTTWGGPESSEMIISDDKSSATMIRKVTNDGFYISSWELTKEDPKGPVKIEILFKGKIIQTFNYVIE